MTQNQIVQWLFYAWCATEIIIQIATRTNQRSDVKDRGSLLLLLPAIYGSVTAAFWLGAITPRTIPNTTHWIAPACIALFATGLIIRWTAVLTLGRSFSANVAIHDTQQLYTGGIFRFARHPSYTGMLLIFTAIGLSQRNWISLAIMLTVPVAALAYRIHVEEAALHSAFGTQYDDYSRRTKRLIPGIL